jgi:transcriptional regulator with XRE-family HTH domain
MVEVVQDAAAQVDVVREHLEKIGAALRDARLEAGLTQGEVGQLAGVSRQLVSRIEQGYNGEISAYVSVAAALERRVSVVEGTTLTDAQRAALGRINSSRLF